MRYSKALLPVALSLLLLGAGCSLTQTVNVSTRTANTNTVANTNASTSVRYPGQDGKNALELLQSNHTVDVSAQGFVNAIDDRQPADRQFWAYYVNGKQADVGAKEYQTKNGDQIEWKLESY
ncbi:MAG: DUF4430 domain-containing protein [Candidatus Kerfeldbacteria bacterium]|nr:DUF4430 domain-containing protein [Candidatus Kerfeldbacteria bacterium]